MSLLATAACVILSIVQTSSKYVRRAWRWNMDLMDHIIDVTFASTDKEPIEMINMSMSTAHTHLVGQNEDDRPIR